MCRNHYNAGLFGSGNPSLPAVSDFSENGNFKNGSIKSLCLVRQVKVNRNFFFENTISYCNLSLLLET